MYRTLLSGAGKKAGAVLSPLMAHAHDDPPLISGRTVVWILLVAVSR
jgi:hypothetical protein